MKIVFMGTPDFSVPALDRLVEAGHDVAAVITQPDKPKGRGKEVAMTPVKERALALGIPVYQPKRVRETEFVRILKDLDPDVMVVIAFGQILSREILDIPRLGCVNIHASLLPKYRGAAPIQWAIIDGEKETGVTTMLMDEQMDTGDMLETAVISIEDQETGGSLFEKLSRLGGDLIVSTLEKLEEGTITPRPQPEEGISYVKKIEKSMGDIDWSMEAEQIERLIRGLNPWPSAYTSWNSKTLKLWEAEALSDTFEGVAGQVVHTEKNSLYIKTGKGTLAVKSLQLEGKKRMDTGAFLRGYPVEVGTVLERRV